ncbi:MAG: hypothetical protein HYY76_21010 [Acidobacteria bacterium]|nr:hypothetical protein [Acidobacteriota bacterium]
MGANSVGGWAPTWWFNDNPNRPMTPEEFEGIQRGDRLYAVVYIEYRNVFLSDDAEPNLTIYCTMYDTSAPGMVACRGGHVLR